MQNKKLKFFSIILSLALILGFSILSFNKETHVTANDEIEKAAKKSEKEVDSEIANGDQVPMDPSKQMWQSAVNMANGQKNSSQELQQWILRVIMEKNIVGEPVKVGEAVKIAKERLVYEKAWLSLATEKYGIIYSDAEVDTWISNGPDKSPVPDMFEKAEAQGVTVEEMNHTFDRDFYVKWVVWEKLRPVLAKEYGVDLTSFDGEKDPNTALVEYFHEEILVHLNK